MHNYPQYTLGLLQKWTSSHQCFANSVLTNAVARRRMERRVRAEVKVVSLLTRASFLIST